MKDELIDERSSWFGDLTLENIEAIAERLKAMLRGKRYTFVSVNELFGPLPRPEVRTSQRLNIPDSQYTDIYVHYGDDKSWGMIGVNDSYGVWSISTHDDPERRAFLSFEHGKLTIEHCAPGGNKLIWVIAVERGED
jgi:hypothetical protein